MLYRPFCMRLILPGRRLAPGKMIMTDRVRQDEERMGGFALDPAVVAPAVDPRPPWPRLPAGVRSTDDPSIAEPG